MMTLPNLLTLFRIFLTPVFIVCLFEDFNGAQLWALIIFIIASITDAYDGYYARKNDMVTDTGRFLDPLADKILVSSAFISFAIMGLIDFWMVGLIIFRDLFVTALRLIMTSNGFTMTNGTSDFNRVNGSYNYCSWNFKANGTGSANSDGATASTVSANTTSGFSIVKWSGTGSNTTIGHGLGAVPRFIIVKGLGSSKNWATYHAELGNTKGLHLNENHASSTETSWWNSTSPTSSVFTVGTSANVNASGTDYMAYVFTDTVGYSKAGIYTGNGSSSGVFVYTGFRPSFVLIKNPNGTNPPELRDDQRVNNFNPANGRLWVNKSDTEATENMDFLSNGFRFLSSDATTNGSNTNVYFAIGQSLVGSNNVPCTAR